MITNGLPCTFSLLSPHYPVVGGRSYKWIALHLFSCYPHPTPGMRGRGYKWIALYLFAAYPALPQDWEPWLQMDCLHLYPAIPALPRGWES